MKLTNNEPNYCFTVIRLNKLLKLDGLDNLLGCPMYGYQALVNKSMEVGQLCLLFTAETELDPEYCKKNNLYRHAEKNLETKTVGYIEDNGRIRAIKLRNNISSALVMPIDSIRYLGIDTNELKEGDCFTHIDDKPICKKYIVWSKSANNSGSIAHAKEKVFERINVKLFPEHIDTSNWNKFKESINPNEQVIVTAKLHGTSLRLTNQLANRKWNWFERLLNRFGVKVLAQEYDVFSASRRVIKQSNDEGYYKINVWSEALKKVQHTIPKGWVVFGEIIGWAGDKPIQKNYTYQIPQGAMELYVYRIAVCNPDGLLVDLSWDVIKYWCNLNDIKHVPELFIGKMSEIDTNMYMNKKFRTELCLENCPPLDDKAPCDEGVVIRLDNGYNPKFYKNKSPEFLIHETKGLDKGEIDIESSEQSLTE